MSDSATPQMAAHQAPPSLGFSKQEHWSGLSFPSPGDLAKPGFELAPPAAAAAAKSLQSCPTVRPHRRQPTRLPHPWDSPGKNTGVGCHFLLQCMKVKSESEVTQSYLTCSDPHGLQPTRLLLPWDFPGKSTGVGCHCLLHPWC